MYFCIGKLESMCEEVEEELPINFIIKRTNGQLLNRRIKLIECLGLKIIKY